MKKLLIILVTICSLIFCFSVSAVAEIVEGGSCGDNVMYKLDSDGVLTIFGNGKMEDYTFDYHAPWFEYGGASIKKVIIEEGITHIGAYEYVFDRCYYIEEIIVNENNAMYSSDKNGALYNKDKTALLFVPEGTNITEFIIPEGVKKIGKNAFYSCDKIVSVTIPEGTTNIEESAFEFCKNIKSISIPDSVTRIESDAFRYCQNITEITLPKNLNNIADSAFSECTELVTVRNNSNLNINWGLKKIDKNGNVTYAEGCEVDENGFIFSTNNGKYVLLAYAGDEEIATFPLKFKGEDYRIYVRGVRDVILPEGITVINERAFADCATLTSIVIPDSVKSIEEDAFYNCYNLKKVTFGNGVESIGESAFYWCSNITDLVLPDSVMLIEKNAFCNCNDLKEVSILGKTELKEYAFRYCNKLEKVSLSKNVTRIGSHAFDGCNALTSILIPQGVISIDEYALGYFSEDERNNNFIIYGYKDSVAEVYSKTNGFLFEEVNDDSEIVKANNNDLNNNIENSSDIGDNSNRQNSFDNLVIVISLTAIIVLIVIIVLVIILKRKTK